jgi:hypothetical protein
MGRFGDVLECQGHRAVGSPTVTSEGLTCNEDDKNHVKVQMNGMPDESGLTLLAGSPHHQHIVAFQDASSGTKFALVELQLPSALSGNGSKTSD